MKKCEVEKLGIKKAIEFALRKIVEQGGQCKKSSGLCAYKNERNMRCAIGWLLDETNENLMASDRTVGFLWIDFSGKVPGFFYGEDHFLFELFQCFHDRDYKDERVDVFENMLCFYSGFIDETNKDWKAWIDMGMA